MKHPETGSHYLRLICSTWNKYFKNNGKFKQALLDLLDENEKLKIENAVLRSRLKEVTYVLVTDESEVEK